MAKQRPQDIRVKVKGELYRVFPSGLTVAELVLRTGLDEETVRVELIHLLGTQRARWLGQNAGEELVHELLVEIVKQPHLKFFLSPAERESMEPRRGEEGAGGLRAG